MFYEQRGPLVLSVSLHLLLLISAALFALVSPEKKPEELVFILEVPPAGGYAQPSEELPVLDYKSDEVQMPTEDEFVLPKLPELPPEVVKPTPTVEPVVEPIVVKEEPKPAKMSLEEFQKKFGKIKTSNVPKEKPVTKQSSKVNLSKITSGLDKIEIESVSSSEYNAMSRGDQDAMNAYIGRFRQAIRRAVEKHPIAGDPLHAKVSCDIAASGLVSNVQILASSGDRVFDQKILAAFKSMRFFDTPPDNRGFKGITFDLYQE